MGGLCWLYEGICANVGFGGSDPCGLDCLDGESLHLIASHGPEGNAWKVNAHFG